MASHIPSCKQACVSPCCAQHHTSVLCWSSCGVVFGPLKYSGSSPNRRLAFFFTKLLLGVPAVSCASAPSVGTSHLGLPPIFSLLLTWPLVFCSVCLFPIPVTVLVCGWRKYLSPAPLSLISKFPAKRKFQVHSRVVLISSLLVLVEGERPWTSWSGTGDFTSAWICQNSNEHTSQQCHFLMG